MVDFATALDVDTDVVVEAAVGMGEALTEDGIISPELATLIGEQWGYTVEVEQPAAPEPEPEPAPEPAPVAVVAADSGRARTDRRGARTGPGHARRACAASPPKARRCGPRSSL